MTDSSKCEHYRYGYCGLDSKECLYEAMENCRKKKSLKKRRK